MGNNVVCQVWLLDSKDDHNTQLFPVLQCMQKESALFHPNPQNNTWQLSKYSESNSLNEQNMLASSDHWPDHVFQESLKVNFGNAVSDKGIVYLKSFDKVYAIEEIQIKEIKQLCGNAETF